MTNRLGALYNCIGPKHISVDMATAWGMVKFGTTLKPSRGFRKYTYAEALRYEAIKDYGYDGISFKDTIDALNIECIAQGKDGVNALRYIVSNITGHPESKVSNTMCYDILEVILKYYGAQGSNYVIQGSLTGRY